MPTVADLLAVKGSKIHSISPSATVLQAVRRMIQHQIGALVVMREGCMVGMFTERDVLRRVMAKRRLPEEITVGQVMTTELICCLPHTDVEEASGIMQRRRIRHLPVRDAGGNLHGLISIGDLNAFYAHVQKKTVEHLTEYIYGRA